MAAWTECDKNQLSTCRHTPATWLRGIACPFNPATSVFDLLMILENIEWCTAYVPLNRVGGENKSSLPKGQLLLQVCAFSGQNISDRISCLSRSNKTPWQCKGFRSILSVSTTVTPTRCYAIQSGNLRTRACRLIHWGIWRLATSKLWKRFPEAASRCLWVRPWVPPVCRILGR